MRRSDKQGIYTGENNAPPTWCGADGEKRYDATVALVDLTLATKLLIARLSVTLAILSLAHGGVASAGRVATFPESVGPVATVPPEIALRRDHYASEARRGG